MPADVPCLGHGPQPGLAQRAVLRGIRAYQLFFSPMYAGSCRYLPSCSAYASEAVERHGVGRGGWLALRRLMRCNPFGGHGFDPVPTVARPEGQAERRRGKAESTTNYDPN